MLVNQMARHRLQNFFIFLLIVIAAMVLVYVLSYFNWFVHISEPPIQVSSSTPEVLSTAAEPVASSSDAPKPREVARKWKKTMTTVFWVGEPADADNAFITNVESYWDEYWQKSYGGVDDPNCRKGYYPCGFTPKENPFYFALPYAEDLHGVLKDSAKQIPWYGKDDKPLLKNRWIIVRHQGHTCYAQWEDVGPMNEDDFAYVFGNAEPSNTFEVRAGLDTSPALWNCLQMSDNGLTEWAFVDAGEVPAGPWKDIVTTSGRSWGN